MNLNLLNVLYFSSDLFVDVAAVSIVSLLENNKNFKDISIYYIDDNISKNKKSQLETLVNSYSRKIYFIPAPDPSIFFSFNFKERYQMGHSYMRMCIGSLIPYNVDRILCLDSDTLILGNLSELWNIEMGDNILAGVADCLNMKAFSRRLHLNTNNIYCNAGMFLINLEAWRNKKIEDNIKSVIKKYNGNIFFFEQTLMNLCCKNHIIKLSAQYNCYTLFYAFSYKNLIRWRKPTIFYTKEEVSKAIQNPIIIHFTRNFYMTSRPWIENCEHPMTDVYRKYMLKTPWKHIKKDTHNNIQKWKHSFIHLIPQDVLAVVINILYNKIRPLLIWKNE